MQRMQVRANTTVMNVRLSIVWYNLSQHSAPSAAKSCCDCPFSVFPLIFSNTCTPALPLLPTDHHPAHPPSPPTCVLTSSSCHLTLSISLPVEGTMASTAYKPSAGLQIDPETDCA